MKGFNLQRIAQARDNPLNRHCRNLLKAAGQPLGKQGLGAPELLQWALEQKEVQLNSKYREAITSQVESLTQVDPVLATRYLWEKHPEAEDNSLAEQVIQTREPVQAAEILLEKVHQMLQYDLEEMYSLNQTPGYRPD